MSIVCGLALEANVYMLAVLIAAGAADSVSTGSSLKRLRLEVLGFCWAVKRSLMVECLRFLSEDIGGSGSDWMGVGRCCGLLSLIPG